MNLRRKRHDQKMTQEELTERAGLRRATSARSSAATCRRASPFSGRLRKRWVSSRVICCYGDPHEKAEPPR